HSIFNIGMLPHLPFEKIISTGNSAGLGALKALSSIVERKKAEELSGKVEYVELATYPSFNSCFARSLFFPQVE
ncbi:MAG: ATP-binding protein, partial [Firmicutes bacterium]|nr:ATP-binding protein [Bacillota bacterium]